MVSRILRNLIHSTVPCVFTVLPEFEQCACTLIFFHPGWAASFLSWCVLVLSCEATIMQCCRVYPQVVEHGDSVNRAHGFHMENKLGMLWDKSNSAMAETLSLMAKLDSLSWRANRRDHLAIRESTDGSDGVPSESESSGDDEESLEDMNDCTMLELCQRLQVSEAAMSVFKANVLQTEGSSWQLSGLADYGQNWDDGDIDLW